MIVNPVQVTQAKSTRELIVSLLAQKWPLSVKQIHFQLKKDYSTPVTYQAVHKLLIGLEKEQITVRNGSQWQLNSSWLQHQETFFQQALQRYSGNKNKYDFDPRFEGTQTFEFDSFTDLCVETAKLLASRKLNPKAEPFWCVLEYGWLSFKFNFGHLELLYTMVKNCPKSRNIIQKKTSFGEWIWKQYQRVGGIGAPIGTHIGMREDIFIQGDYIIEVQISKEGKKVIEQYWNKWKNLNDLFKDFGLKKEPKIESTVKITKNPQLASFMKNELEKYFQPKTG